MESLDLFPIIWKEKYQFNFQSLGSKVYELIEESDTKSDLEYGGISTVGLNLYEGKRPHTWKEYFRLYGLVET